ncbi:MAG TPA: PepSY domain-containing protein [candidate division Zixibacteria bacterium]|nr:PepSY domain-containing protein [candidate division Zixibacteria bacterium]
MKRLLGAIALASGVALAAGVAGAQWRGPGGGMGPGMMRGAGRGWMQGAPPCAGAPGAAAETITEEKAKELATAYADRYLKGFTVERVLPFTGRFHTMYSVELKNEAGEVRTLHVNPFGNVMPFGGPWRRG